MLYLGVVPVGIQIYLKRSKQHLTQAELAKRAGIPQPNLSNIETGGQDITVSTLRKIAVALAISPGEFFSDWNKKAGKTRLTRRKIERIAKIVAGQTKPSGPAEREISRLFKTLIPSLKRRPIKELYRSWLELKMRFNSQEINNIYARAQEYARRKS